MSPRIAVGGFKHESHSFAPHPARYADFLTPGGQPPLSRGERLLPAIRGTSVAISGAVAVAEAEGVDLVPLVWASASPSGPVQDEAFERVAAMICAELSSALDAGPLDGIYLELHGAGVAQSFPDMEGELLRRVRAIAGPLPLTISLDPHCNLTRAMVDQVDALVPYRTYPHVDMPAAGAQAMRLLLARIARGRPWARAFRQADFLIPLNSQCTMVAPMEGVMEERAACAERGGAVELGFCFGFPYADFPDRGPSLATYADTQAQADAVADEFLATLNAREASFALGMLPADKAVAEAMSLAAGASKPVVVADTQDNPGGGGHGDTTGLLAEFIRQRAAGVVLALINDPESADACHRAGQGAQLPLSLGGKSDGVPLPVTATVLTLTDGRFIRTGPMGNGNPANIGPTALVEVAPGIRVIVCSRKMQPYDRAILRHVGVEPSECRIIAVKSSVHFRADFQPIAAAVIIAQAPGPVMADSSALPFRHLRQGMRLRPMDNRGFAA